MSGGGSRSSLFALLSQSANAAVFGQPRSTPATTDPGAMAILSSRVDTTSSDGSLLTTDGAASAPDVSALAPKSSDEAAKQTSDGDGDD
ncbi:MAG TPA: hypothetical protein VIC27_02755 [Ktedonobacterales bacterium]